MQVTKITLRSQGWCTIGTHLLHSQGRIIFLALVVRVNQFPWQSQAKYDHADLTIILVTHFILTYTYL